MGRPALDLSKLSPAEKLELMRDERWASFGSEDFEPSDALRDELDRRVERLASDPASAVA